MRKTLTIIQWLLPLLFVVVVAFAPLLLAVDVVLLAFKHYHFVSTISFWFASWRSPRKQNVESAQMYEIRFFSRK